MSLQSEHRGVSQAVLEKITKENLKMKSLLYFVSVSLAWRILAALVLFFSALFLSLTLYEVFGLGLLETWKSGTDSFWETFPFFLLVISFSLVYFSAKLYRKSRICCRHEDWALFFALMSIAIAISAYFYFSDLAMYLYKGIDHYPILKIFVI